jgi:hypothetical protein
MPHRFFDAPFPISNAAQGNVSPLKALAWPVAHLRGHGARPPKKRDYQKNSYSTALAKPVALDGFRGKISLHRVLPA